MPWSSHSTPAGAASHGLYKAEVIGRQESLRSKWLLWAGQIVQQPSTVRHHRVIPPADAEDIYYGRITHPKHFRKIWDASTLSCGTV